MLPSRCTGAAQTCSVMVGKVMRELRECMVEVNSEEEMANLVIVSVMTLAVSRHNQVALSPPI